MPFGNSEFIRECAHSVPKSVGRNGLYKTVPMVLVDFVEVARLWGGQQFASSRLNLSHHGELWFPSRHLYP